MDFNTYLKSSVTGEVFHLPVNPFSISGDNGKILETFNIMDKGEVDFSAGKARPVDTINITTTLPDQYEPFCSYKDIPDRNEALKTLNRLMNEEKPLRLIITGYDFNRLVWLENIKHSEEATSQGLRMIDLPFRIVNEDTEEVKVTQKKKKKDNIELKDNRPKPKPKKKIYTVKKGDTLWGISKKHYGKGADFKKIYNANKKVIGNNPNIIKPGQKFIIP